MKNRSEGNKAIELLLQTAVIWCPFFFLVPLLFSSPAIFLFRLSIYASWVGININRVGINISRIRINASRVSININRIEINTSQIVININLIRINTSQIAININRVGSFIFLLVILKFSALVKFYSLNILQNHFYFFLSTFCWAVRVETGCI